MVTVIPNADAHLLDPGSLRVRPDNWTAPLDLVRAFARPPHPLEIDLGCGKGRFLLAHAQAHPDTYFLGIDRQLLRIERIERNARSLDLRNIRLLYVEACYAVTYLIPAACVQTYYLFFPDPWPKRKHRGHRLFDAQFLDGLVRTMTPTAHIHIATDHLEYFDSIHAILCADPRFEEVEPLVLPETEKTDFELEFLRLNRPIGRSSFRKCTPP